ncbi:MAG: hypothetical protein U0638_06045 [Phycisphaerales bacterium]
MITWKRTLRTLSSERFIAYKDGREAALVDLHFLGLGPRTPVSGTVVLLESSGWREEDVPDLLSSLDEEFLPEVDAAEGTLTYTVVMGRLIASYEAMADGGGEDDE